MSNTTAPPTTAIYKAIKEMWDPRDREDAANEMRAWIDDRHRLQIRVLELESARMLSIRGIGILIDKSDNMTEAEKAEARKLLLGTL
jgi:hypothetical protein